MPGLRHSRGFTLVDVLAACTVVALVASIALPSYLGQLARARRMDATAALQRLQAAEERVRSHGGAYTADFARLQLGARSDQGLWLLAIDLLGPEAYRARAIAQTTDADCPELWLEVRQGFAQTGPSARCWNR